MELAAGDGTNTVFEGRLVTYSSGMKNQGQPHSGYAGVEPHKRGLKVFWVFAVKTFQLPKGLLDYFRIADDPEVVEALGAQYSYH